MSPSPRLDTAGMWEAAVAVPERLAETLEVARGTFGAPAAPADQPVRAVVGFGVGTGAVACDAAAALTSGELSVPFLVCHDSYSSR